MAVLFIETDSPPPFYQAQLTTQQRQQLDKWFIGHRSQAYYLKRFAEFDAQGHLSAKWHWSAFFMTFPWLLYRKRYLDAIVYSVAGWSFIQLNITIILVAFEYVAMDYVPTVYQMAARVGIALLVWVFWSVLVARWSDAYYYRMARREIADALEAHPRDQAAQQAHLRREGGVSMVGLGLGFAFYAVVLLIIKVQFLPIVAKQKEQDIVYEVYDVTRYAQQRVNLMYERVGHCPTEFPLSSVDQRVHLQVRTAASGVSNSDCVIVATVRDVPFPNRYLNGQTLVLYHKGEGQWGCVTSLNKKQMPKQCLSD